LHNLAIFSVLDFERFDEEWFWKDYRWLLESYPGSGLERFRSEFERRAMSRE